jgi:hypothetical protein
LEAMSNATDFEEMEINGFSVKLDIELV